MTKKVFDEIMGKVRNKSRVVICVRAIHGRGINGVDELAFSNTEKSRFEFIESLESYIIIKFGYNGYMRKIYIPFEEISRIEEREYDATRM